MSLTEIISSELSHHELDNTILKGTTMINQDKDTRRISLRKIFQDKGFILSSIKEKADEFRYKENGFLYFYWGQGKEPNIAIDPNIEYSGLLKLDGVVEHGNNFRHGTAMTEFPKKYEASVPKHPQSHVGRMFVVREEALSSFLSGLAPLLVMHYQNKGKQNISAESAPLLGKAQELQDSATSEQCADLNPPLLDTEQSELSISTNAQDILSTDTINLTTDEREAVVKVRFGQGGFRDALIGIVGAKCWMSGIEDKQLLVASHIKPWSHCKDDTDSRGASDNGLLLSSLWDSAFDAGLISFDEDWRVICSTELSQSAKQALNLGQYTELPGKFRKEGRREFLTYHRAKVFECWKKAESSKKDKV